jgi:hypothetical protein
MLRIRGSRLCRRVLASRPSYELDQQDYGASNTFSAILTLKHISYWFSISKLMTLYTGKLQYQSPSYS